MQHSIVCGVDGSQPSRSAAPTTRSTKEVPINDQTPSQGAVGQQHVGRFSGGIEQLPDTPSKRRIGRFSAGIEQCSQGSLCVRRFSEGIERLPRPLSSLRRGSFANGYDEVR
jgi:hypothetical protein